MTLYEILALTAGACFIIFAIVYALRAEINKPARWQVPAAFCFVFFCWSLGAVIVEGPTGLWTELVRNMWGNQIWFDLLLAIGVGWFLIAPKAKALKMNLIPWLMLIVATGSIGTTAMLARLLYLQRQAEESKQRLTV